MVAPQWSHLSRLLLQRDECLVQLCVAHLELLLLRRYALLVLLAKENTRVNIVADKLT